jgi:hypothetical protein
MPFMRRAFELAFPFAVAMLGFACDDKNKEKDKDASALDPATRVEECERTDGGASADDCYDKQALKTHKSAFCERIVASRPKNTCFQRSALGAGDVGLCAKLDDPMARSSCRAEIAKQKGDPELCKQIERPEVQMICVREVAKKKGDPEACKHVDDADARSICFREIARFKKDVAICDLITNTEQLGECVGAIAIDKPDLCDRLKETEAKDRCLSRALTAPEAPKDTEGRCDKIQDPNMKATCWSTLAARHDPFLCEKPVGMDAQQACYASVIAARGDENICAKIPKPERADACFVELAVRKRDAKLCERAKDPTTKKGCAEAVSKLPEASSEEKIKAGVTRKSPTDITVTREAAAAIAKDQESLAKSLRILPERSAGKVVGMRLFGIRPDGVAAILGFQNDDRVLKVNGFDVGSADASLVPGKLGTANTVVVEIERRGAPLTVTFTIK